MSRNMIEANKYIFEVLAKFAKTSEVAVPVSDNKRCIETNTEDKKWLQEIKIIINKQLILPKFQTASFEFKSQKYFVAVGWQSKQTIDSDEVIEFVELNAGKPKENEAINKLVNDSPEEALQLLREIKRSLDGTEEGKCGDLFYKIRNYIVHFRRLNESIDLNDENWDMLIRASLYIVEYWYNQYDEQLRM